MKGGVDIEGAKVLDEAAINVIEQKPFIGLKELANPYLITNKWILSGYRINYNTWGWTFWSLFQWHNESINIWTHFVGFLICLVAMLIVSCAKVVDEKT